MMGDALALAIEALSWVAYSGLGERSALFKASRQLSVSSPSTLRHAYRLIMQTLRTQNRLDYILTQAIPGDLLEKAPHGVRSFLRIFTYLKHQDKRSPKELTDTLNVVRRILGSEELQPFEKYLGRLLYASEHMTLYDVDEYDRLALETYHPIWFVRKVIETFGRSSALKMLQGNLRVPSTYIRLNQLKGSTPNSTRRILEELKGAKVNGLNDIWRLEASSHRLALSDPMRKAEIIVQDLSSIVACQVAHPRPGTTVLDLCAAPGNKTSHLAALMEGRGEIYSLDISTQRLLHWKKEMARAKVEIASPIGSDARNIPFMINVDLALVDPPCSNTGLFARTPSAKWRIDTKMMSDLPVKQHSMLKAAAEHVEANGRLVYCTCSILPEENEDVVEAFLKRNPEFQLIQQNPFLGSRGLKGFVRCQRFYTHLHDCNGYFIAMMQRRA